MKKYANLVKAMSICAGPGCDKSCPYNGKGARNKSCRSMLLEDAMEALVFEEDRANEADEHIVSLNDDIDTLEAATNTLRAERDALRADYNTLRERCQVQQNEINALVLKLGGRDVKTDRPSVGFEGSTAYWCGRADALAEVMNRYFFGEAVVDE